MVPFEPETLQQHRCGQVRLNEEGGFGRLLERIVLKVALRQQQVLQMDDADDVAVRIHVWVARQFVRFDARHVLFDRARRATTRLLRSSDA